MKERFGRLKEFHWRLFAALSALALIPAIYQTIRTFIISSNNQSAVFDVVGQMEWFDLINETLQAFLIKFSRTMRIIFPDTHSRRGYWFLLSIRDFQ